MHILPHLYLVCHCLVELLVLSILLLKLVVKVFEVLLLSGRLITDFTNEFVK